MKKLTLLLTALLLCCALLLTGCGGDADEPAQQPANAGAADDGDSADDEYYVQDLDISNDTGVAIMELYISPATMENWGDDLLGDNSFDNGATVHFNTELVGTAGATWDIMVVDEDGDQIVFTGVDFSSNTALSLNWGSDGQTPMVSYK